MYHSQEDIRDYTGPPDSLMAELELRKHELKHRSRTAADPQGLRSTLLQLDAVAQKQSERRQRPVSMAWDNSNAVYNGSEGDEDVPLGILYPEKPDIPVETRPLDLMEKRQMAYFGFSPCIYPDFYRRRDNPLYQFRGDNAHPRRRNFQ